MSTADRILANCCPESPIDVFTHAARITEVVAAARFHRLGPSLAAAVRERRGSLPVLSREAAVVAAVASTNGSEPA